MAVAGDIVAEALSCPRGFPQGAPAIRIHAGDAVRVERAPPDRLVAAVAGAPGVLATATARAVDEIGDPGATVRIEIRSTVTGVLLYAVDAHNGRFPGSQPMLAVQQDAPQAAVATCTSRSERPGRTRRSRFAAVAARPSASGCSRRRHALRRYRSLPFDVSASYVNPRAFNGASTTTRSGRLPDDGRRRYVPPPPAAGD
jgi:hypothetical protein